MAQERNPKQNEERIGSGVDEEMIGTADDNADELNEEFDDDEEDLEE